MELGSLLFKEFNNLTLTEYEELYTENEIKIKQENEVIIEQLFKDKKITLKECDILGGSTMLVCYLFVNWLDKIL